MIRWLENHYNPTPLESRKSTSGGRYIKVRLFWLNQGSDPYDSSQPTRSDSVFRKRTRFHCGGCLSYALPQSGYVIPFPNAVL